MPRLVALVAIGALGAVAAVATAAVVRQDGPTEAPAVFQTGSQGPTVRSTAMAAAPASEAPRTRRSAGETGVLESFIQPLMEGPLLTGESPVPEIEESPLPEDEESPVPADEVEESPLPEVEESSVPEAEERAEIEESPEFEEDAEETLDESAEESSDDVSFPTAQPRGAAEDGEGSADDEENSCFPAGATVELQDGTIVPMSAVSVGDVVKFGVNEFSRVFMFTHKLAGTMNKFVSLRTTSGELELTPGHYLFVKGALAAAGSVRAGDDVTLASGESARVEAVGSVRREGLYNPQTVSGNIVVNGVLASTYTKAVEPSFAHAILAPFRMLSNVGLSFTALESGGGALTQAAPKGAAVF